MKYRRYASGDIVSEEDFAEYDNAQPYYDDYAEMDIPDDQLDMDSLNDFEESITAIFDCRP